MHKYLALAFAVGYTIFISVLSFISLNDIPKLGSSFDDKIYHLGAYLVLTLLWYYFLTKTSIRPKIQLSAIFALSYGIIVEVFQGAMTCHRLRDVADVFANSIGIASAIMLTLLYRRIKLK